MRNSRQKIVSLMVMISLILGNISPVLGSDISSDSFSDLDLLEEDIQVMERFLESEVGVKAEIKELEDFSIKEDLEDLQRLETYESMYRSNLGSSLYGVGMAAGYEDIRIEAVEKTLTIKSKLNNLIDTLDIVELERLKASYGAEAEISQDIAKIILKILSMYENVDNITSFKSAIKSVKAIVRDLREIKSMIKTLRMKISINKIDRNLTLNYVKEVDRHIENKIFEEEMKLELRKFFLLRLDSSINKELLKLEMRSERLKISCRAEDLDSLELRLLELSSIIDFLDYYKVDRALDEIDPTRASYSQYLSRIEKNMEEVQAVLKLKEDLGREVEDRVLEIRESIQDARVNHESFTAVDIDSLEEKLSILDYYISNQSLKEKRANSKIFKVLENDLRNLKKDLELRVKIQDLLSRDLADSFKIQDYDYFTSLVKEVESKDYVLSDDELRELETFKLVFQELKLTYDRDLELEKIVGELESIKVNKFKFKQKLARLLDLKKRVLEIDEASEILIRIEEKERALMDLPGLLDLELAL